MLSGHEYILLITKPYNVILVSFQSKIRSKMYTGMYLLWELIYNAYKDYVNPMI